MNRRKAGLIIIAVSITPIVILPILISNTTSVGWGEYSIKLTEKDEAQTSLLLERGDTIQYSVIVNPDGWDGKKIQFSVKSPSGNDVSEIKPIMISSYQYFGKYTAEKTGTYQFIFDGDCGSGACGDRLVSFAWRTESVTTPFEFIVGQLVPIVSGISLGVGLAVLFRTFKF